EQELRGVERVGAGEGAERGGAHVGLWRLAHDAAQGVERVLEIQSLDRARRVLDHRGILVTQPRADRDEASLEKERLHRVEDRDLHLAFRALEELLERRQDRVKLKMGELLGEPDPGAYEERIAVRVTGGA